MKEDILNWLRSGQDYNQGVQLYGKYGHNKTLLKNFLRRETTDRKQKLAYKLVTIAKLPEAYITLNVNKLPKGKIVPKTTETVTETKETVTINEGSGITKENEDNASKAYKGAIPFKDLPQVVIMWIVDRIGLEKKRTGAHSALDQVPKTNDEKNKTARRAICDNVDKYTGEINALNDKIQYYEKNLKLPEEPKAPGIMARLLQIGQDLRNAGSRRSKLRALISGTSKKEAIPAGPKKKAAEAKLKEETILIEKLQREQKALENE